MSEPLFPRTKIQTDFSQLNKLLYGWPKTGKTSLAAQQKSGTREPLFIATEDGHNALEVSCQKVNSWAGFVKLVEYLEKNRKAVVEQYSCFVLDLITDLDAMCTSFVGEKAKVQHLSDLTFGKGFALQKQAMQDQLRILFGILPITFIAHATEKELQWNNEKINVQAPSISKGTMEYVNGKVDCIMMILPGKKGTNPTLTMMNSTTSIAGSRFKQLVRNFPMNMEDHSKTYDLLQKTFAGSLPAGVPSKDHQETTTTEAEAVSVN